MPSLTAPRERTQRAVRVGQAVIGLLTVAYIASLVLVGRPADGYLTFWDGWVSNLGAGLPALAIVAAVLVKRQQRAGWTAMAIGVVLNLTGNLIYTYHDQNLSPVPSPGPADIVYLASYIGFSVGLALLTQRGAGQHRSTHLDGAIAGLSVGAIATALWFGSILTVSGSSSEVAVGLAYPLFDVVFIVVIVAGLAPQRYRPTWSSGLLIAGVALFALGDVVYLDQIAADTYRPATILEGAWAAGIALFGLAPWAPTRRARTLGGRDDAGLSIVPAVFAFGSLAVLIVAPFQSMPPLAPILAGTAVALAITRTLLSVRELRQANESRREARTDELTGLPNRRSFLERLNADLAASHGQLALMIIDLDGFKEVNDTLGHHAGDDLLRLVTDRFRRVLPADGFLARLGGDEFGVCIRHADLATGSDVGHTLLKTLTDPFSLDGVSVRVAASAGVAVYPIHGTSQSELLRHADTAMYRAKRTRSGLRGYDPADDPNTVDQLSLLEDLRNAIAHNELIVHFQPTLDLRTQVIIGVEALVRWPHPTQGLLLPDRFIPLAERSGLIPHLTRAVLDAAVADIAQLTRQSGMTLQLSVNISAHDLVDETFPQHAIAICAGRRFPTNRLTLEITETALIADPMRAAITIRQLRGAGVRISVDDFGVGYSSMAQLLELAVDELKLDRSFVTAVEHDSRAHAIVKATIELAHALDLNLVAEGVESPETLAIVTNAGCDVAQGFHIARSMPISELTCLLETRVLSGA